MLPLSQGFLIKWCGTKAGRPVSVNQEHRIEATGFGGARSIEAGMAIPSGPVTTQLSGSRGLLHGQLRCAERAWPRMGLRKGNTNKNSEEEINRVLSEPRLMGNGDPESLVGQNITSAGRMRELLWGTKNPDVKGSP